MRLPEIVISLALLAFPVRTASPAPAMHAHPLQYPIARIPFYYDGVHIIIAVTVDNYREPLHFIFDTGSEVNVLSDRWKKIFRLYAYRSGDLSGAGNGLKVLPITEIKTLHVGRGELLNQDFYLEHLRNLDTHSERIDGIIGYHLLASYIVKIDFNDRVIELYKKGRFDYGTAGELLRMRMNNYTPVIRAGIALHEGDTLTGWYQITSGGDYGVLFNYPYMEKYRLATPAVLTGKDSVNDLLATRQFLDFRLPAFVIGNHCLQHVDATFCPDVNDNDYFQDIAGDIGNGVFRHFNIILNYGQRELFLESNGRN
ncbi:MAG TPA: hypothetical protein VNE41_02280 [Chitinophagaceae bacterium]|nr:hypothetical protein [Chitinophagaceae bacterium]